MVSFKNMSALALFGTLALIGRTLYAEPATAEANQPGVPAARPATSAPEPALHHAPVSVATAHRALTVVADIRHPELVKRALLIYRRSGDTAYLETEFKRAESYAATIPESAVVSPSLEYLIELERLDGTRQPAFASRGEPFRVLIPEDLADLRERALAARLGGRRSEFASSAEYVSFGRSTGSTIDPATGEPRVIDDSFYRLEGSYTYRPLRTVADFSLRLGLVRGRSPVSLSESDEGARNQVGLNYGAPTITVRASDFIHLQAEVLTSITEAGFAMGGGGAIELGDHLGAKLALGFETIEVFGTRVYSRLDLLPGERLRVSPIIEVTDMPHANAFGVRLLTELGADLGNGFHAAARGGYQARKSTSGGVSFGATLGYAF